MLKEEMRAAGYEARRPEVLAIEGLLARRNGGARALLLEGPPGCGKTALGEVLAEVTSAELVYSQLHAWSGDEDLFCGVDVRAAVAGEADAVRQDGVLAIAARASQEGEVVVLLDEIDKAPERAEALLLDWLQSGRVPVRPGVHLQTRLDRVIVVLTSNGQRPLSDALLRRVRRLRMQPLPVEILDRLAEARSGAPRPVVRLMSRACREVAEAEGNPALSLQEIAHACHEAWTIAESCQDVHLVLAGWAARTPAGEEAARRCRLASAVWAEVQRERRGR